MNVRPTERELVYAEQILRGLAEKGRPQVIRDMVAHFDLSETDAAAICLYLLKQGKLTRTRLRTKGAPFAYSLAPADQPNCGRKSVAPDSPQQDILAVLHEAGRPVSVSLLRSRLIRPSPDLGSDLSELERVGQVVQIEGRWGLK